MATTIRQGDVLLARVDEIPEAATVLRERRVKGRLVLAYGEATGHHHSVAVVDAEMLSEAEAIFLRVMRPTPLEHQEHSAITLEPGAYRVTIQREYEPQTVSRMVAD